ncbi:unnamed protein product [Peniophora sp. CBMAI 1063]|nr:unnamed protein product [Peniophora sp. CBMAI 1063]
MSSQFIRDIRARPAATVALFRNLLLGTASGGGTYTALELAVQFRDLVRANQVPVEDLLGRQTWASVLSSGLLDIYADAVSSPNFFSRPLDLISAVLLAFAAYCEEVEDSPRVANPLLARTNTLWISVWNRQDELKRLTSPAYKAKLIIPLIELHYRFSVCYLTVKRIEPPILGSYMHYTGLLLYTLSDQDDSPATVMFSLRCFSMPVMVSRMFKKYEDAVAEGDELAHQHILSHVGIEKLILRFKKTFNQPQPLHIDALHVCLLVLWGLACSPSIQLLILKHHLFEGVCRAVSLHDKIHPDAEARLRNWAIALDILGLLSKGRLTPGTKECSDYTEGVRGQDVTDHLARGVRLAAEMNGDMVYHQSEDPSQRLWQCIRDHNDLIFNLPRVPRAERTNQAYASPIQLVQSMISWASEVWHPSLSALRAVENRRAGVPAVSDYGSIIDIWTEHGTLLGLQGSTEKKGQDTGVRQHCSWDGCVFSFQLASEPLRACTGCGKVSYCSEKCQKGDWKRHKKECKRTKAA